MSEERPSFKVTDRRLFNPDGTPRDIVREEETPMQTNDATANVAASATQPPQSQTNQTRPDEPPRASQGARDFADENPEDFINLLMFIASPAAAALGLSDHPGMPAGHVDLPLAKHCIDLLGTLQHKTRGNLSAQEEQMFEGLLAELRMQYVSLTEQAQRGAAGGARGGGFSGSDITGGR